MKPGKFKIDSDFPYGLQVIAFRMPGLDSPDYAAAEVLVDVLNSQRGTLYGLVPQGKALGTGFSFGPLPKASLAYAVAAFPKGGDAKALDTEMRAILERIAKHGVPADLVAAAKLQEKSGFEFQKNSIGGLASVWSEAVAGDALDVVQAESGDAAVEALGNRSFDLIVAGVDVPGRKGFDLVDEIRERPDVDLIVAALVGGAMQQLATGR